MLMVHGLYFEYLDHGGEKATFRLIYIQSIASKVVVMCPRDTQDENERDYYSFLDFPISFWKCLFLFTMYDILKVTYV